ncbi:hypothetical protein UlMin_028793 [Ulmus minor]
MAITEFLLFVLTATLGGMFLCRANDLITIFVAPECFSLCSYLLSGYTKKDVRSNEATMKYLLMGGASSSILVHGFSWLYVLPVYAADRVVMVKFLVMPTPVTIR